MTDERLSIFYDKECSYFERSHFDIKAPDNIRKYETYREIIVSAGLSGIPITDVGCGRGGFLIWLNSTNWRASCQGVDIDVKSIPAVSSTTNENATGVNFQEGGAFKLPFASGTQAILTYFHVLEHVRRIDSVLKEAFRVLSSNGHIMIEVPDAGRYSEFPVGTAFWPGIREHINHFTPGSICHALKRHGFEKFHIKRGVLPTPEFSYPSLIVLARKSESGVKTESYEHGNIASFIIESRKALEAQAESLSEFCVNFPTATFWGCSSELFSLLPMINMSAFSICDSSKFKQKCYFRGIPISDPATMHKDGALVVAPYLHGDIIEKAAIDMGWQKEAIFRLR